MLCGLGTITFGNSGLEALPLYSSVRDHRSLNLHGTCGIALLFLHAQCHSITSICVCTPNLYSYGMLAGCKPDQHALMISLPLCHNVPCKAII